MIEDRYREYYDRLIAQSNAFIEKYCRATGSFQRLLSGKPDPHFLNDYRFYTFTKSTKSLMGLKALLNRLTNDENVKRYVLSMVPWHMKPNIYLSMADKGLDGAHITKKRDGRHKCPSLFYIVRMYYF